MGIGFTDPDSSLLQKELNPNMNWKVTTAPTVEPITLAELKTFAHIDGDLHDTVLTNIIAATRQLTEDYLGRALIEQSITLTMDFWPKTCLELPKPPLLSITSVATLDESDVATTFSSGNYYAITNDVCGKLVIKNGSSYPTNGTRFYGGYRVIYKAGYGSTALYVPQGIKEGMKTWAAMIYDGRVPSDGPPPIAAKLLDFYKVMNI